MGDGGWTWAGPQRSTLVLGPSRSGKTSSLVIPNILLAKGPVVSTSTKSDVMDATAIVMCRDYHMPLRVFNLGIPGELLRIINGEDVGTLVTND